MTQVTAQRPVVIEVWEDLVCPWCYLGKHRLEKAIAQRPDADRFALKLRSFELNPGASHTPESIESWFIRSHGGSIEVVLQAERRVQALAQSEGLAFSLDRVNANTFDFHRLVHYADEGGRGLDFFSLVQDRYFAGEINPFDPGTLVRLAEEIGLSGDRIRALLGNDDFADEVRSDRVAGEELGVQGVPFTVVDRSYAVSGAQSVGVYAQLIARSLGEVG